LRQQGGGFKENRWFSFGIRVASAKVSVREGNWI
jgi:hypothetical protein